MTAVARDEKLNVRLAGLLLCLVLVSIVYLPTLLTDINGSSDDFMADTGEEQIVLNTWGTLHPTGYPLFVIQGNLIVRVFRAIGFSPSTAPSLVALLWGLAALCMIYVLALRLTGHVSLAISVTGLFGLTRWVWIHNVIPEVYSFALFIYVLLLLLALTPKEVPHRLEWLAFLGGLGIAHHRGLILAIPPVIYAVYPQLLARIRRQPQAVLWLFALGLIGFVPYIYLPLRAHMGATWVYGQPGTLAGFWDQFMAREARTILTPPATVQVGEDKLATFYQLLSNELSLPGLLLGLAGLGLAVYDPRTRRAGMTFLVAGLTAFASDILIFDDILAPFVTPMTLSLSFGWIFFLNALLTRPKVARVAPLAGLPIALLAGAWLIPQNYNFIYGLTHDPTGLETVKLAEMAPSGSTLMINWGARYFAVGFAQDVLGNLKGIRRADHESDLKALSAKGPLVTPDYTFYDQPISWWQDKLEARVFLRAVAPHLVQIDTSPQRTLSNDVSTKPDCDPTLPVTVADQALHVTSDNITLQVDWLACGEPSRDLSVFVHLLDSNGSIVAQADEAAPVYGLRPLTTWQTGEIVRDIYSLPYRKDAASVQFGLYEKLSNGAFQNYKTTQLNLIADSGAGK